MSKVLAYLYISILAGANLIFGFIVPISREPEESKVSSDGWSIPAFEDRSHSNLNELLSSGFWGEVDSRSLFGAGEAKEVAAEEAKKLRAKVKAIVNRSQNREVLFNVDKDYHRVLAGETLPGTDWVLVEIGEDWLKLSKDGSAGNPELLKLFAFSAVEGAAATKLKGSH